MPDEHIREGRRLRRRKPRQSPKVVVDTQAIVIDERILATARRLAGGDKSRLVLRPDGTVIIANSRAHAQKIFRWK